MKATKLILLLLTVAFSGFGQEDKSACKNIMPSYLNRFEGYYISDCQESEYKEVKFFYYPQTGKSSQSLTKGGKYRRVFFMKKNDNTRKMSSDQIRLNYHNAVMKASGKSLSVDKTFFTFVSDGKEVYLKVNAGGNEVSSYNIEILEAEAMKQELAINLKEGIDRDGKVALYGILFETGKSDIMPESAETLRLIIDYLNANVSVKVIVVGHTDNTGTYAGNMTLSRARAESVKKYLVSTGKIAPERLIAEGVGQVCPVSTNSTEEGKALNRRVEIVMQ